MNVRCLLLPTILLLALPAPGCSPTFDDPPVPDCTAPPPPKTAELLVGKWRVVEFGGKVVSAEWHETWEFTADGRVETTTFVDTLNEPPVTANVGYRVAGQTVHFDCGPGNPCVWEMTIHSLTGDTVVATNREVETDQQVLSVHSLVMKRMADK